MDAPYSKFNDVASETPSQGQQHIKSHKAAIPPHPGWQHYFDSSDRCYYVQDGTGTTQWTHPTSPTYHYVPQSERNHQQIVSSYGQQSSDSALLFGSQDPYGQYPSPASNPHAYQQYAAPVNPGQGNVYQAPQPQPDGTQPQPDRPAGTDSQNKIGTLDANAILAEFDKLGGPMQYIEKLPDIPDYVHRLKSIPIANLNLEDYTKTYSFWERIAKDQGIHIRFFMYSATYIILWAMLLYGIAQWKENDIAIVCFSLSVVMLPLAIFMFSIVYGIARCMGVKNFTEMEMLDMMWNWQSSTRATVFDRIQGYQLNEPQLTIRAECFHYETRTVARQVANHRTNAHGVTTTTYSTVYDTVQVQVHTHIRTESVPITGWVDTSPRNVLDICEALADHSVLCAVTYDQQFSLLPEQSQLVNAMMARVYTMHKNCDVYCVVTHSYTGHDDTKEKIVDTIVNNHESGLYKFSRTCFFNPIALMINIFTFGCWFPAGILYKTLARNIKYKSSKTMYLGKPTWFDREAEWISLQPKASKPRGVLAIDPLLPTSSPSSSPSLSPTTASSSFHDGFNSEKNVEEGLQHREELLQQWEQHREIESAKIKAQNNVPKTKKSWK